METEEILSFLNENEEAKTQILGNYLNVDYVKSQLETNKDLKSYFDSEKDKHSNLALNTWKANNLKREAEKLMFELNPDLDPTKKEIMEIKNELAAAKQRELRKDALLKGSQLMSASGINTKALDFYFGDIDQVEDYINFLAEFKNASMEEARSEYKEIYDSSRGTNATEMPEDLLKKGDIKGSIGAKINNLHSRR